MLKYPLLDLMIIGAQKSYTTSLKTYLGEHPSIVIHPQQEMAFFTDEKEYTAGYEKALAHYYKDLAHYEGKKMVAKNAILYINEAAIKRLYDYNPNCKIAIILRNPVDRAYSAYLMEYNYGDVDFPFNEIKEVVEKADTSDFPYNLFVDAGNYAKHLKNVYKYFPKEHVKVILCEELKENPIKVCSELFQWVGVDSKFEPKIKVYNPTMKRGSKVFARFVVNVLKRSPSIRKFAGLIVPSYYNYKVGDALRSMNKTNHKYEPMAVATRQYLVDYYRPSNKELEEMTGKKITSYWDK